MADDRVLRYLFEESAESPAKLPREGEPAWNKVHYFKETNMQWILTAVSKALGRRALVLEKNSPAILFGAGLAGMVGSTVLACRATLKLEEVLDEGKENVKKAKTLGMMITREGS